MLMSTMKHLRKTVTQLVFGNSLLPQEFTIGLSDPQTEVSVWLHGMGAPRDITQRHSTASSSPFVIAIAFDKGDEPSEKDLKRLFATFCERSGRKRVLGKIGLRLAGTISPVSLPEFRLGAHYLRQEYQLRRIVNTSDIAMSFLERRAAIVTFIRPHPISLVSVAD